MLLTSSAIVQDLVILQEAGLASMAYFYFDFRDDNKKSCHNMLLSLLTQFSSCSDSCCDILSRTYKAHKDGQYKPNTSTCYEHRPLGKHFKHHMTVGITLAISYPV